MEITKREILLSTLIISIMVGLGIIISNPITATITDKALKTISSVQVKDSIKFDYIRRTDVGDFLAEGDVITIDPVSINDIPGYYSKIKKVKEEYTLHTRVVTTTDSKGNVHSHTETYWEWDVVKQWHWEATKVQFLGVVFTPSEIGYSFNTHYQETIDPDEGFLKTDVRYKYYTCPTETNGVLRGFVTNKTYKNLCFMKGKTIDDIVDQANNSIKSAPVIFWVLWSMLIIAMVILFYYFDNEILNS